MAGTPDGPRIVPLPPDEWPAEMGEAIAALRPPNPRHPLPIFAERCGELAEQVKLTGLPFIEAVDIAYGAAEFAGLVDAYGDDRIQRIMAGAFMGSRKNG